MNIILENLILEKIRAFVNNIEVKNPKIIYNNEEFLPGIKRYILEYF